jgi:hypothetical protein
MTRGSLHDGQKCKADNECKSKSCKYRFLYLKKPIVWKEHKAYRKSTTKVCIESSRRGSSRRGSARRGSARRGSARRGSARRGSARRASARRGAPSLKSKYEKCKTNEECKSKYCSHDPALDPFVNLFKGKVCLSMPEHLRLAAH